MRQDFWLKLASVCFALVLWFFVVTRGKSEVRVEAPVLYEDVPAGLVVVDGSDWGRDVFVSGHERLLRALSPGDVKVKVSLKGASAGTRRVYISAGDVVLPPSLEAVEITPGHVDVHLEREEERTLPVQPVVVGKPREGFSVAEVKASPPEVRVKGPASELKGLYALSTEPLDISGADRTVSAKQAVMIQAGNIALGEREVEVTAVIRRQGR